MISVENGKVTVSEHVLTDDGVVAFFGAANADGADLEQLLEDALEIGIIALQRIKVQGNVDMVRREFDDLLRQFEKELGEYFGDKGKLPDMFDPDKKTSAVARIQQIFDKYFNGDGSTFYNMLDYTEEGSPLRKLRKDLVDRFKQLEDKVVEVEKAIAGEEARKQEYAKGTRKGIDFETYVADLLERPSRTFGDVVRAVGTEAAVGDSKKGDILIEVNRTDARGYERSIVIECKRQKRGLDGKNSILVELEEAIKNRGADYAIAVFSREACPQDAWPLRTYHGDRLICAVAEDGDDGFILEAAYAIARARVCLQESDSKQDLDGEQIVTAIKRVEQQLTMFAGIKGKATQLGNNLEGLTESARALRKELDTLEQRIRDELDSLQMQVMPEADPR